MRTPRLLTIVGPSAALYVLSARAWLGVAGEQEALFVVGSMALAFSPLLLVLAPPPRASRHLSWVGVLLGVAIASAGVDASALRWVHGWAWLLATSALLDLTLRSALRWPWRLGMWSTVLGVGLLTSFTAESLEPGFAVSFVGLLVLMIAGFSHMRRQIALGHPVEGVFVAVAIAFSCAGLCWMWLGGFDGTVVALVEFCVASILWLGHLGWVDPERRALRRSGVAFVVASLLAFALGFAWSSVTPDEPLQLALMFVAVGVAWFAAFTTTRKLTSGATWTVPSELAARAELATQAVLGAVSLEDIAAKALAPFAEADQTSVQPTLHALEPPVRMRLDESGRTELRSIDPPEALVRGMMETPMPSVDAVSLRERMVREPAVRALAEVMEHEGIGVVLRCAHLDHVEGLLTLPLAKRAETLSKPEQEALASLGEALGSGLAAALTQRRAESHIQALSVQRREAEDRVSVLEEQLAELRGRVDNLDRGLADERALHVAYSASMRRLQTRAIELAAVSDPVLLVAGAGTPVVSVARFVHERGPRWEAPFVVRDCAAASPTAECIEAVGQGTLVLRDLPALAPEDQRELIERVELSSGEPRVIATTRIPKADLARRGTLAPEWLAFVDHEVLVPSLRERREDLPSLVLFAIDRACRVLAVDPIGIEQDAMAALLSHDWPGDVAELEFVIESAVAKARDDLITTDDLPPLAWPRVRDGAVLDGTYAEVERKTLARALARAEGNKSEAARMLGLKRTTFVDKLRRHGLERKGGAVGGSMAG